MQSQSEESLRQTSCSHWRGAILDNAGAPLVSNEAKNEDSSIKRILWAPGFAAPAWLCVLSKKVSQDTYYDA